ncbi:DUF4926 domain-containing protein [Lichenibacterium ramalinae]|uniref:DUF4926 domain-containing protein n=1 Tax=Lichenibacterium ramalinae TaxID=2316527 RepID=A0A4Q2RB30_9HYPH|nr:DUF4926 domain-containing protein [Lichenibacterium ramalinae]RYB02108.1 DUF4926 domain-containing protein [Lichenibacterium ramalinae]
MNAPVFTYPFKEAEPATFANLDLVRVLHAVVTDEEEVVISGSLGTVVAVYGAGKAYEVEFEVGLATIYAADLVKA